MRTRWKVLIASAMVLPTGAFVVASLMASAADRPTRRDTIVIQDPVAPSPAAPTSAPTPVPTQASTVTPPTSADRSGGVEDVTPQYDDLDDDGRSNDNGGGRDDHSGSGRGGNDDRSGDSADHGGSSGSSGSSGSDDDRSGSGSGSGSDD